MCWRDQRFLKSLNGLNVLKEHQDIKIPTLALYGSSDLTAIGGDDGVSVIAEAINQVAPGNGHFKVIEDTNHHLSKVVQLILRCIVLKELFKMPCLIIIHRSLK
ncbi:hypothetical protein [Winogradskyella sp.]|uniref:hypothetical protein n=1 Tax=Winogradskyella sp. TaxID=1883156 RepID=UPI002606D7D7|nr:hypothetical protein [Winogradskyella sp.]